jgi:hypothetical protein
MVEHLVGYAKSDLMVPLGAVEDLGAGNVAAAAWCAEVNAAVHSEICAVPADRLNAEHELLSPLPSRRPRLDRATFRKGRQAVLRAVRVGALLGAEPADRISGRGARRGRHDPDRRAGDR